MSMYLLLPEEAAREAFVRGDNSAYTKLAAELLAEELAAERLTTELLSEIK